MLVLSSNSVPAAQPSTATAARTGGAVPGQRPPHKLVAPAPKPMPKPKAKPLAPKRSMSVPGSSTVAGVFPVVGPFTFGGADARFGAQRNGHIHQGQDVVAASGQQIVSPLAGTIIWTANQPAGAGIYVILHGGDGRDYAFMHIKQGTTLVSVGEAVHQGQQLAQVGATGDATGPHLHFEIWVGGWGTKTGVPIDPLPQLKRWAGL